MLCDVEESEVWRPLPGKRYAGYEVSDGGRVRSIKIVAPAIHKKYESVRIGKGKHRKVFPIHELMSKVGF